MATTLKQYWTAEAARLTLRNTAQDTLVGSAGAACLAAQAAQRNASDNLRTSNDALDAARRALAGITMPGDGDPLLLAMQQARVSVTLAQAALAQADRRAALAQAEQQRLQAEQTTLAAALLAARSQLAQATQDEDATQALIDTLSTGSAATLSADAAAALANHETTARLRVEGEFPDGASPASNLLDRARARRQQIEASLAAARAVEAAALAAAAPALDKAQAAYDQALSVLRATAAMAPQAAADAATLERLAALPAQVLPDTFPILTTAQARRLRDPTLQAAREAALDKLTDVDDALAVQRAAQKTYDLALLAAMKAEPDKTQAQLDAGTVQTEATALANKTADVATKQGLLNAAEWQTVQSWFAAVPDSLWDALDQLDGAAARLQALVDAPTPADRITAFTAAETALAAALDADRKNRAQQAGARLALARAAGAAAAERDTAANLARSSARGAALS